MTTDEAALKLATDLVAKNIEAWGWGPLSEIEGLAEHDLAVKAALAAILEVTERAAKRGDALIAKATWFRFCPNTGEFTGEYCSVRPHDETNMIAMVPVEHIATAIRNTETDHA